MTSDAGVAKQYSEYARQIQETLDALQHMQETPRLVTSASSNLRIGVG